MKDAATALFNRNGYAQVTLEQVAERAEVSVGTIYNYYQTKRGLMLAILVEEGASTEAKARALAATHDGSQRTLVKSLISLFVRQPLQFMDRDSWREALAAALIEPDSEFGAAYRDVDRRLGEIMGAVLSDICADPRVGGILFNNINQMFTEFLSRKDMTIDELEAVLLDHADVLLDLLQSDLQ